MERSFVSHSAVHIKTMNETNEDVAETSPSGVHDQDTIT